MDAVNWPTPSPDVASRGLILSSRLEYQSKNKPEGYLMCERRKLAYPFPFALTAHAEESRIDVVTRSQLSA
jgi:hypothetical protein